MGRPLRGQAPASFKTEQLPLGSHTAVPALGEGEATPARAHTNTHTHISTQPSGCTPLGSPGEAEVSLAIEGGDTEPWGPVGGKRGWMS